MICFVGAVFIAWVLIKRDNVTKRACYKFICEKIMHICEVFYYEFLFFSAPYVLLWTPKICYSV